MSSTSNNQNCPLESCLCQCIDSPVVDVDKACNNGHKASYCRCPDGNAAKVPASNQVEPRGVDSLYLLRSASGSGPALRSAIELLPTRVAPLIQEHPMPERTMHPPLAIPAIPPSIQRGTDAEESNVSEYLVDKTSIVASGGETRINQYGLMFEHVAIHQRNLSNKDYTHPNPDVDRQHPFVRVSPAHQPSPMEEDVEYDEDVDMQGQPQVTFNLQEMDIEAQQPNRWPPSPDVMDKSCDPVDDEIALVAASMKGTVVINVSDVESYGSEYRLIGDSTDEDNDEDDEGVTQGD